MSVRDAGALTWGDAAAFCWLHQKLAVCHALPKCRMIGLFFLTPIAQVGMSAMLLNSKCLSIEAQYPTHCPKFATGLVSDHCRH